MTDKSFDHKKAATIIIDMHTLVGLTANRARNAGVDKKKIDEIFDISASMTATLLATLHIDGDILNEILIGKLKEMEEAFDTSESKEAVSVAKANILGANNDATA